MARTVFKDKMLAKTYDFWLKYGDASGEAHIGSPLREAYEAGRQGIKKKFIRSSNQTAAYAAGRDNLKNHGERK